MGIQSTKKNKKNEKTKTNMEWSYRRDTTEEGHDMGPDQSAAERQKGVGRICA